MDKAAVIHNTFVIEKSYAAKPERVFAAFADPAKKRRWFVERGHHTVESYELDFRPGGKETSKVRFNDALPVVGGLSCSTEATYLDIVKGQRLVFAGSMTIDGKCVSAALCTVELEPTTKGTDLHFTHQAVFFEGSGGPDMRKQGWQGLFDTLDSELAD